jgi:hypothetical protein
MEPPFPQITHGMFGLAGCPLALETFMRRLWAIEPPYDPVEPIRPTLAPKSILSMR